MKKDTYLDEKDEYINKLENEIRLLYFKTSDKISSSQEDLSILLQKQNEFLIQQYQDKDSLLAENKRLIEENARLARTIQLNHQFIGYLSNSFWWKLTYPFRYIYRHLKNRHLNYEFVKNILLDENVHSIESKVSILIFSYNAGEEFTVQLNNIKNQKYLDDFEIIVIDRGSSDNTKKYAKKYGAKLIDVSDYKLSDSDIYEKILPEISGEYVVQIEQNKVINSKYWIYQSILPLLDEMAVSTVFFKKDISEVKKHTFYNELKDRITSIAGEQVLFFPENRNMIQCFSPLILENSVAIVKKRISNLFLV